MNSVSQNPYYKVIFDVDIYRYPTELINTANNTIKTELTIGDLHGNALKLIHFLIAENVLLMSELDFNHVVEIYKNTHNKISQNDFIFFNDLLQKVNFNPIGLIRFLGDEVADRGHNDLFTLLIFKAMREKGIPFEIIFSNHALGFIESYQIHDPDMLQYALGYSQSSSWYNLRDLIGTTISKKDFNDLIEDNYKPFLKILAYANNESLTEPALFIYSHAPIGLETIKALARCYGVTYCESSIDTLSITLDKINACFKQDIETGNLFNHPEFSVAISHFPLGACVIPTEFPLIRILWNRARNDSFLKTKPPNAFQIEYIHGHEGPYQGLGNIKSHANHMTNLDATQLGKGEIHTGPYIVGVYRR